MLIALLAYLVLQLAIGAWISRRIRSETDYLLAGRRLGYPLLTFSIFATWFGAETVMGSAGEVYANGVSPASAEPFGYGLCLVLMGAIFAVPLWNRKLTTLADLFRQRYSIRIERLAAVILIPGSILWAAAQVRAFGNVLSIASGDVAIPLNVSIGIAAAFVIAYTAFGGLLADAVTDLLQGVVLIVGIVTVTALALWHAGGVASLGAAITDAGRVRLTPEGSWLDVAEAWAIPVCGSVLAAELVGRVVAARTPQIARNSSYIAAVMYVAVGLAPVVLGLVGAPIVPHLEDPEQLVPALAGSLLHPVPFTILLGALVSAILSTVDSALLAASSLLSHNLAVPLLRIEDEKTKVRIARWGVVAFGALSYGMALHSEGVLALVEQASAFGSAGVLVTACFGLFTRYGGARAAAATMVVSLCAYLFAAAAGASYPFLISLGTAVGVYVLAGARWRAGGAAVALQG